MIAQQLLSVFNTLSEGARRNGLKLLLLTNGSGPTEQFHTAILGRFPNATEEDIRTVCAHVAALARVGKLAGPWGQILALRGTDGESVMLDTVCS